MRDKREILNELVEQAVTAGINWSKNSSTPVKGVNIDVDLRLPIDTALTALSKLELGEDEIIKIIENAEYDYCPATDQDQINVKKLAKALSGKLPKMDIEATALLKRISKKPREMLYIMEKNNIVINNLDNKIQKFAFTVYSELVQFGSEADAILGTNKRSK